MTFPLDPHCPPRRITAEEFEEAVRCHVPQIIPDLAITVLIGRVERIERVLRNVRAALPARPLSEPMREGLAPPSAEARLAAAGEALAELDERRDPGAPLFGTPKLDRTPLPTRRIKQP